MQLVEPMMMAEGGHSERNQGSGDEADNQDLGVTQRNCWYYLTCGCLYKPNDQYNDLIINLFNLVDLDDNDNEIQPFFLRFDRKVFLGILEQLDLAINHDQDQAAPSLKEQGELLEQNARDLDIVNLFKKRTPKKFEVLEDLVYFRQRAIDIFGLADKNNDKTLYKI